MHQFTTTIYFDHGLRSYRFVKSETAAVVNYVRTAGKKTALGYQLKLPCVGTIQLGMYVQATDVQALHYQINRTQNYGD